VQPVAIVLVNALAANLELNIVDKIVTNPVEPAERGARAVGGLESNLGKRGLEINTVDQITIALNRASYLLAKVGRAVERVLNRLHREIRVSTIYDLEKGDLGITREIYILRTICNELHETTTCHFL